MIELHADCALLDIEGTTSSTSFVFDVLYPYAKENLRQFIERKWNNPAVRESCLTLLGRDESTPLNKIWDEVEAIAADLMNRDVKSTPLKELQGFIWEEGFSSGSLRSHVYPDVLPALETWRQNGVELRIFSSGSIHAQQLFFRHTELGDLIFLFSGHYDTTYGAKRDSNSYLRIAEHSGFAPSAIVFFSDIVQELDAAAEAGIKGVLCLRPGNATQPANSYDSVQDFSGIIIKPRRHVHTRDQ